MRNWKQWRLWQKAVIVGMGFLLLYELITTIQALINFIK